MNTIHMLEYELIGDTKRFIIYLDDAELVNSMGNSAPTSEGSLVGRYTIHRF